MDETWPTNDRPSTTSGATSTDPAATVTPFPTAQNQLPSNQAGLKEAGIAQFLYYLPSPPPRHRLITEQTLLDALDTVFRHMDTRILLWPTRTVKEGVQIPSSESLEAMNHRTRPGHNLLRRRKFSWRGFLATSCWRLVLLRVSMN